VALPGRGRLHPGELLAGATALHLALDHEAPRKLYDKTPNLEIVRMLMEAGADPNATDSAGQSPLHFECWSPGGGSPEFTSGTQIIHLLLDAGADPNLAARDDMTHWGVRGITPLHQAVKSPRKALPLLLVHAAEPDVRTCTGVTPLHYAIGVPRAADDTGAIELLVAAGADVNARLDDPPALQEALTAHTPLGIARELNKPVIAAFLQRAGAVE
jgi:ankyrin repeat protein